MNAKTTRTEEIAHARKVDTEIARLYGEYWFLADQIVASEKMLERNEKTRDAYGTREFERERVIARIEVLEEKLTGLKERAKAARAVADQYNKDNYGGWTRFFLVQHIHNTQFCSSFRPTTRVGWLPDVSGLTEAEAVKEHGATLCTICFPSAPVELTVKAVDPNQCEGSGKGYSKEYKTGRENSHYGRAGYCPVCLRWQTVTASGVMRKHKADDETRRHALDKR